jgi:hypothetical protein
VTAFDALLFNHTLLNDVPLVADLALEHLTFSFTQRRLRVLYDTLNIAIDVITA